MELKDSGTRREFSSGAVRDIKGEKVDVTFSPVMWSERYSETIF